MQIERAELLSSQGLGRQSFSFKPDRLNLLSTNEEKKKADLFSAIALVFCGGNQDKHGNMANNLKEGSLELTVEGKKLFLRRNFESNLLEFKSDENLKIASTSELLSGISKDMFNSLFLVGQDNGGMDNFVDRARLLSLLGQIASLSEHSINVEKSVRLVEEKLEKYPFLSKVYKIDDLIGGLTRGKVVLEERLLQLEHERKSASVHINELNELEQELAQARRTKTRTGYFQLCLETAELDSAIMKVQERMLHQAELKHELATLGDLGAFPISALRKVQELWTMRQSRINDRDRLDEDICASNKERERVAASYAKEAEGLGQLLTEDAQQLYGLAKILTAAQEDLERLNLERTQEMRRLKEVGVDFDSISLVRKVILTMEPCDLEEANKLSDEVKSPKGKLASVVALSETISNQLKVHTEEIAKFNKVARQVKNVLAFIISCSTLLGLAAFVIHPQIFGMFSPIFLPCLVLVLMICLIALSILPRMQARKHSDFEAYAERIMEEQNKIGAEELALSGSFGAIQERAKEIASKYGLSSSADLFKKLQVYSSFSARLKGLDVLDHMLATREKQLNDIANEAMTYFERIKRKPAQVTPAAISGLASEVLRYKEGLWELERGSAVLNHRISERRFLEGEIAELDSVLETLFFEARLLQPKNLEASFAEFDQKSLAYRKWESLSLELQNMEKNLSAEILEHDLSTMLQKLQCRRTEAWSKMQVKSCT